MFHPERKTHLLQPGVFLHPPKTNMEPETCSLAKGKKASTKINNFGVPNHGFGQLSHSSAKLVAQNSY